MTLRRAISWAVFTTVVAGAWLLAGPASLGGPASYVIVSGRSMEPTYQNGDLVVAYGRDSYEVGDVIVYDAPIDQPFDVIHRIVSLTAGGFVTQGDNRDEADGWIAPHQEIHGAALFHIPKGGAIVSFLREPPTILAIGAGWVTLILLERSPRQPVRGRTGKKGFTSRQTSTQTPQHRRRRSSTPVSAIDDMPRAPRLSRTAKKAAERTARRKKRSTFATVSLAALGGVSGAILFAHAATLNVNAGVLQAFQHEVALEPPSSPEYAVTVYAHFFDSSSPGEEIGRSPVSFQPVQVKDGQSYQVTWNGPPGRSTVVDCTSDEIDFLNELPDETYQGIERVTPEHDATHLLCIQTASGNVPENISFEVFNGEGVDVELTPSDDDEPDGSDHTADQAQDAGGADLGTGDDDSAKDSSKDATDESSDDTDSTDETDRGADATDEGSAVPDEGSNDTGNAAEDTSRGESYEADGGADEYATGDVAQVEEDEPEEGVADNTDHEAHAGEYD